MAKKRTTSRPKPSKTSQSNRGTGKKAWTVMVYMAAAKDDATEKAAIVDIGEMQNADLSQVNVVVQVDRQWPPSAQRFRVTAGASQQIFPTTDRQSDDLQTAGRDMSTGSSGPLIAFLESVASDPSLSAERYLLVLWGHTYGLGFGRDHGDQLTLGELKRALSKFRPGLDILGANTCAMSYAEAAFELRNSADYLVASQMSMPFAGWPYKEVLNAINADPKAKTAAVASAIAVEFMNSLKRDVSMTVLALAKAERLVAPVKDLAAGVSRLMRSETSRERVVGAFLDTAHGDVRPLIDLVDLCANLKELRDARVTAAADELLGVLDRGAGFVVQHSVDDEMEGIHGVGIFAPGVTGEADRERLELSRKSYRKLELVKQPRNLWSRLAFTELSNVLGPRQQSVADFVRAAGATTGEERTGLMQLVMSLDRAFVKLELALADTKRAVDATFDGKPGGRVGDTVGAPARFGPPFLRLIGIVPHAPLPETTQVTVETIGRTAAASPGTIVDALAALEQALGNTERTVKRVLTNPTLGLGDNPDVKPGVLGADNPDVKPGVLGADNPDVKPGVLGIDNPDVKPGVLGLAPWLAAPGLSRTGSAVATLIDMYREVAYALRMVEESVGKLETVLRTTMFSNHADRTDPDFLAQSRVQIDQALREVKDVIENAKHTTRGVVVDPAEGLGPGMLPGRHGAGRQQLALAGGLSSKYLRLM